MLWQLLHPCPMTPTCLYRAPVTCCSFSLLSFTPGQLVTGDPAGSDAGLDTDGQGYPGTSGLIIVSHRPAPACLPGWGESWEGVQAAGRVTFCLTTGLSC